jgi:hypothetical protein
MATEAPPQKPLRKRRMEQQPDNDGAFAQYFTETNADGQLDPKSGKYTSGPYKGKTLNEAMAMGRDEFAALNKSTPGFADKWGSRARGEDVSTGPKAMGQLPENMRGMPNAPDLSGFQQFDKQGRQVSGPSPSARQRFMDSVGQASAKKTAATNAVNQRKIEQINNPAMVADMSIAAKDAQLAQSGITDLGGGTKAMTNKYGTGFATTMTPQEAADRKAGKTFGTIMDEKGSVDVKGMMANKGKGTTTPYQPGSTETPSLNMDAGDAIKAGIQTSIAGAMPGADARRASDRMKTVAAVQAQQAPMASTPGFSPTIAGPLNPTPQIPPPAGVTAQAQPQAPKTPTPIPAPTMPAESGASFGLARSQPPAATPAPAVAAKPATPIPAPFGGPPTPPPLSQQYVSKLPITSRAGIAVADVAKNVGFKAAQGIGAGVNAMQQGLKAAARNINSTVQKADRFVFGDPVAAEELKRKMQATR